MITVIVPVYNAGKNLFQCVDSIRNQSYKDLEIILIDDGSTDGSEDFCDQFAGEDSRIRVYHQSNSGVSAARNKGLDIASGEYIMFVDAYDWLDTDYIEIIMRESGDFQLAVTNFTVEQENNSPLRHYKMFSSSYEVDDTADLFTDCIDRMIYTYVIWGKRYHRDLIGSTRFKRMAYSEDALFCREILVKANHVRFIDTKGYHYRISDAGVTSKTQRIEEKSLGALYMLEQTYEICKNAGVDIEYQKLTEMVNMVHLEYLKVAIKNRIKNMDDSLSILKRIHFNIPATGLKNRAKICIYTTVLFLKIFAKKHLPCGSK